MSEMTQTKRGVLFDLDGVLLDSEGQYTIFWDQIDKEYPTGIENFATYIKGFHLSHILGYFEGEELRQDIENRLLEFERDTRYVFFPGALDFVRQLHDAGLPMAIVTSSDRKKMMSLYRQHPDFPALFDHIITGDMVVKAKPDPYCYQLGAQMIGVDIKDCIVVEDSRNGLLAGRASGARVVGIATTLDAAAVSELSDLTVANIANLTVGMLLGDE